MKTYTNEQIVEAARAVVAEKGADYVYPPAVSGDLCSYSNRDGTPSCIVGHIVARLNPDAFATVVRWELDNEDSGSVFELRSVIEGEMDITREQARRLHDAQVTQDGGNPWGKALAFVEELASA